MSLSLSLSLLAQMMITNWPFPAAIHSQYSVTHLLQLISFYWWCFNRNSLNGLPDVGEGFVESTWFCFFFSLSICLIYFFFRRSAYLCDWTVLRVQWKEGEEEKERERDHSLSERWKVQVTLISLLSGVFVFSASCSLSVSEDRVIAKKGKLKMRERDRRAEEASVVTFVTI